MLFLNRMTETEFIVRDRSGSRPAWFKATEIHFRIVDGVWALVFLAAFLGLVFLLSK